MIRAEHSDGQRPDRFVKKLKNYREAELATPTRRSPTRPRLPVRIDCSRSLPAIGATSVKPKFEKLLAVKADNERPFNIADLVKEVEPTPDTDGRHWPKTLGAPINRIRDLEATIKSQQTELLACHAELADLYNTKQQQTEDLQLAREAIERLDKSVNVLREALTRQESIAAAAKQTLSVETKEKVRLQAQLVKADKSAIALRNMGATLKKVHKDRDAQFLDANRRVQASEAELSRATTEIAKLNVALRRANDGYQHELNQHYERLASQSNKFETMMIEKDLRLRELGQASSKLIERCEFLAQMIQTLRSEKDAAEDQIRAQVDQIEILETILRVERDAANSKIQELTAELACERLEPQS